MTGIQTLNAIRAATTGTKFTLANQAENDGNFVQQGQNLPGAVSPLIPPDNSAQAVTNSFVKSVAESQSTIPDLLENNPTLANRFAAIERAAKLVSNQGERLRQQRATLPKLKIKPPPPPEPKETEKLEEEDAKEKDKDKEIKKAADTYRNYTFSFKAYADDLKISAGNAQTNQESNESLSKPQPAINKVSSSDKGAPVVTNSIDVVA